MGASSGRAFAAALLAAALATTARAANPIFEVVTDDIPQPIHIASAGDARLFVASRPGVIYVVQNGQVLQTPFLDIQDLVGDGGEGGLLSIAFHPNYPATPFVFVSYTDDDLDSIVARYSVSGNPNVLDESSAKVLLDITQPATNNHKGGQLQFGPDSFLYFGLGDGGGTDDPPCNGQRHDQLLGKLLRIDIDLAVDAFPWHEIPPSNPFTAANDPGDLVRDEIWATGLRNPWRFSFDRDVGDLWIGDVGQNMAEEIDFEAAGSPGGANYGWKIMEGTQCRWPGDPPPAGANCPASTPPCNDPAYTDPVFEYNFPGSVAITGGYVYRGANAPEFQGRYIFADSSTGQVWALVDGPGGFTAQTLSDGDLDTPVSFGEDVDGELYLADLGAGRVYHLRLELWNLAETAMCVEKANDRVRKFAEAAEKDVRDCASLAAKENLAGQTLEACTLADRKGALAKQQDALEDVEAQRCVAPPPTFGFSDSAQAGSAAAAAGRDLAHRVFGPDLDASLVTNADDSDAAACQKDALKDLASCQKTRRSELQSCKKNGLGNVSIVAADGLEACLDVDGKGKIAAACDPAIGKLAVKTLIQKCEDRGVDLALAFPGCNEPDVADLAACLDAAGRCVHCQLIDAADALELDCDDFDDGSANASCETTP